jgi:hypothetical protein
VLDAIDINTDGDVGGFVADMGTVADLDHQRIEVQDRVKRAISTDRCES